MEVLLAVFSPDYESDWYANAEHHREERLNMLVHQRPAMRTVGVTRFNRDRSNAMRPSQAKELQALLPLMPLVPRGGVAQGSTAPPTGRSRARGMAVRGDVPKF
ncbi:hypothetical protein [Ramlibacter sp.]|uniref:hypothetical protein n=1 Tax=Ramlibacter sp. TaxID=1917967 RepID=UPI003D0CB89A